MSVRPTLLSSCARAATAREAAYRIDAGPRRPRATRVVALDDGAARAVDRLGHESWSVAKVLRYRATTEPAGGADALADIDLETGEGRPTRLSDELADADFVMMVATDGAGAAAAAAVGNACTLRGIMTAGLVLDAVGAAGSTSAAVTALRPHARVLLVSSDQQDVDAVLTAVGS